MSLFFKLSNSGCVMYGFSTAIPFPSPSLSVYTVSASSPTETDIFPTLYTPSSKLCSIVICSSTSRVTVEGKEFILTMPARSTQQKPPKRPAMSPSRSRQVVFDGVLLIVPETLSDVAITIPVCAEISFRTSPIFAG